MYGLFPLVVGELAGVLGKKGLYGLHLTRAGRVVSLVATFLSDDFPRSVVLGCVLLESSWEEDVVTLLARWHSVVDSVCGPAVLVVDEVDSFATKLGAGIVQDDPVVVGRLDVACLHDVVRGVSHRFFYGVEPYSVVDYLKLRMGTARKAKVLEKFPGLSAVSYYFCICG